MIAMTDDLLTTVRAAQLPVVCLTLYVAAAAKLATAPQSDGGVMPGPALLLGRRWRRPAVFTVAAVEIAIATALLVAPGAPAGMARLAAGVVFATGMFVLIELRNRHPEAGCGCFGTLSRTPVGVRTLTRSAVLTLASSAMFGLPAPGAAGLRTASWAYVLVALAELAVLAALSPETAALVARLTNREPCETARVPVERTLRALRATPAWREHRNLLAGDGPIDVWRELCWRYVVYPAELDGRAARAVFAVRLGGRRPEVRAAVVDRETGAVLRAPRDAVELRISASSDLARRR